jgi:hypothetical protein
MARSLAWLALGATAAGAQYTTPVGKGAAKPKTLRATAVLEWTGSIEKPNASRLMPVAVWDGEHYQPAGLYLARPDPLALETGTQYELERSGEVVGLFNVRAAAELNGAWIGLGRFQAEAPPPPPPRLKPSRNLPVLSNGKPADASSDKTAGGNSADRPTLHRKTDDRSPAQASTAPASEPAGSSPAATPTSTSDKAAASSTTAASSASKPADDSSNSDKPTLHRRSGSSDDSTGSGTASGSSTPANSGGTSTSSGTNTSASSDPDAPTLHRRAGSSDDSSTTAAKSPDADPDRPTLHKHDEAKSPDVDPDRPTLHRARSGDAAGAGSIDPDRPRLRYGSPDKEETVLPTRLVGVPAAMQQVVAVSDSSTGEVRPYLYHWPDPGDAAKMQAALAALAAQAVVAKPGTVAAKPAQFGPASRTAAHKARAAKGSAPAPALVDEHFAAYELTFSGGPTLVYSAHTADEGPRRIYVTLIAQPDFSGQPQVLLQQVARGDRLDEVPAMQLVDAVDTDNDQRAELIFELIGAPQPAAPSEPSQAAKDLAANTSTDAATQFARDAAASAAASAAAGRAEAGAIPEREFAIYRVADGKAVQVFDTGPLP